MRLRSVTAGAIVLTLAGAAPAAAEPGDPYVNSCNSLQTIPNCTPDVLGEATTVEVSPDGKHVYLATSSPITSILLFDRTQTGAITRRAGPLGCVTNGGGGGCAQATNMTMAWDMAFSPNGQQLYYSSFANGALLIFDRNPDTGVLTQRTGAAGCFAPSTSGCTVRSGSGSAFAVIASPDGRSVYLKTQTGIAVFSRGTSGQLDQLACVEETLVSPCIDAVGLSDQGYRLAMSPDSRHLYVPFTNPGGVAVFNRNTTTGLLTQVPGLSGGCISSSGESSSQPGACVPGGESLSQLLAAGIDPQGNFVYAGGTGGITVYRRDPANGLLTKVECLNEDGNFGCKDVTGVALTIDFAFAPDDVGPGLISSSVVSSLAFFHRNPATGALTQHTAKACLRGPIVQPPCEQAPGLTGISRVALAPGGLDLYATGRDNGALLAIERDFAPQCEPATLTATSGTAVAVPLRCTDANLDAITLEPVAHPLSGSLALFDQASGSTFYTPFASFAGQDSFTYRGVGRGVAGAPAGVVVNVAGVAAQAVDSDGDGFLPPQDCNDGNPRIRPGAREIAGNGVDENCDTRLGLGRIRSVVRSDWSSDTAYTDILGLRAARTPAGSRGEIRCLGKRCKFKRRAVQRRRGAIDFMQALPRAHRRFLVGQTIEVRITKRFYNGKVVRYPIKSRVVPDGQTLCLPAGENRPRRRC